MEIIKKTFNKIKNKVMNNEEPKEEIIEEQVAEEVVEKTIDAAEGEVIMGSQGLDEDKKVLSNEERRTESVGKNEMAPEVAAEVKEEDIDKRTADGEKVPSFL